MKCYWFPEEKIVDRFHDVVIFSLLCTHGAGISWRLFFRAAIQYRILFMRCLLR